MSSRMRVTKGHRNNRRAHHSAPTVTLSVDKETQTPHMRHRANPLTGTYRGRQVIDVDAKAAKKAVKAAQEHAHEHEEAEEEAEATEQK